MSNQVKTKTTLQQRVSSLISGTQKHYTTGTLMVGGVSYDPATLIQTLQGLSNALVASDAAKAKWNDALTSLRDESAKVEPVIRAYQSYLVSSFGNAPSTLADFGLAPRKARAPLTAQEQAAAAAKSKATRTARNTMGSQQRKKVKGNVANVVVTPVVAGAPVVQSTATAAASQTASPSGSIPHIA
jgi:hypothetical protein